MNASRASEILAIEEREETRTQTVPGDESEAVVAAHLLLDVPRS